ncbi:MAG: sugar ABC transporter permease [Anaerolineae bacterium]|nr:sugar ABC transporter permease [Anaerolineae bacterium]
MHIERDPQTLAPIEAEPDASFPLPGRWHGLTSQAERVSSSIFLWPAVLALLFLSIFPLIVSLYLSLSRFDLVKGGFKLTFIGLANYRKLLFGSEKTHFLGLFGPTTFWHWLIFGLVVVALAVFLGRYVRNRPISWGGLLGRILMVAGLGALAWMVIHTLGPGGRLGTLGVTLVFVFAGIFIQYSLGLGLALLTVQHLPGRRFFRVVFLLPMMITPVGVAYMFRMMTDMDKGPFTPLWQAFGLAAFSWFNDPWLARTAILIADVWQWTPFMFIVLVAALESQSMEPLEAALVDGANSWQLLRYITWPQILPVSLTLILIRMIEAFKMVDLPNVMTNGGPGTATESLTLQAFILWRSIELGSSAAVAYMLLLTVTFFGLIFVNLIRHQAMEKL